MELGNPSNGGHQSSEISTNSHQNDDIDSTCSTPYTSAPSSPGAARSHPYSGYFFSAPASPVHFVLLSSSASASSTSATAYNCNSASDEFEFGDSTAGSMISADELFLNGQIRPMKLSSHLQRPQHLAPLLDLGEEEEEEEEEDDDEDKVVEEEKLEEMAVRGRDLRARNRSLHRRARSMSPVRNSSFQWHDDNDEEEEEEEEREEEEQSNNNGEKETDLKQSESEMPTPSVSASSSRSSSSASSSGRNSKRWIFLKDLLHRSKSEGRGNGKDKFWHNISFSPSKEKAIHFFSKPKDSTRDSKPPAVSSDQKKQKQRRTAAGAKPVNGVGKRRAPAPSPHERHYTANRAQAEEMRKKTFLPYRQGLLGCLGFSSKSYGAMNGFARALNSVTSR